MSQNYSNNSNTPIPTWKKSLDNIFGEHSEKTYLLMAVVLVVVIVVIFTTTFANPNSVPLPPQSNI